MDALKEMVTMLDTLIDYLREIGATDDEILWFFEDVGEERLMEIYNRHN